MCIRDRDGVHRISISQLPADGCYLISIWRDNADALEILLMQPRKHLLLDDIDLALIEMTAGMVTGSRPVHCQHIRLIVIFGHDDQLPVVKLLVAEVDEMCIRDRLKYMTIIGHVTRKMTAVIFAILRDHKVYEPVLPTAA